MCCFKVNVLKALLLNQDCYSSSDLDTTFLSVSHSPDASLNPRAFCAQLVSQAGEISHGTPDDFEVSDLVFEVFNQGLLCLDRLEQHLLLSDHQVAIRLD